VVGFDSIIPPGRVGKVTEEISLKNMHAGVVSKSVSVTSNAENSPSLSLSVKLNFVPAVFASTNYINLVSAKGDSGRENVIVTTDKADLQVKKVLFKANDEGQKPMWQVGMSFDIPYAFKHAAAAKPDGMWDDTLKLVFFSNDTNGVRGEFIITTNHPKKSDVNVQGFIRNAPNGQ
jgi:hypothetical protein